MSKTKKMDNDMNKMGSNNPSDKKESSVKNKNDSKEKSCRDYLSPKDKEKLDSLVKQSGLTEAEILADAFSQYAKKRNPGQRETARYHIMLQEDLRKIIDKIPPEMEELIEMLEEYCSKEEMLCQH